MEKNGKEEKASRLVGPYSYDWLREKRNIKKKRKESEGDTIDDQTRLD